MILTRRKLLTGLIAAPAIVRAGLIMPVISEPYRWLDVRATDDVVLRYLMNQHEILISQRATKIGTFPGIKFVRPEREVFA